MNKSTQNVKLAKMLGRYGVTALAAASVGSVANGQIVHTPDVNDTIRLGDTLQLDFNADAIPDVEFSIELNPAHVDKTWGDFIFTKAVATPGGKGVGAYWYWGDFINPLELDQVIAADTSFTFMNQIKNDPQLDTATMVTAMGLLSSMGWTTWGIYGWGVTAEDTTTYLGYEFRIDEEPRYGWVKVTFHRTNEFPGKNNYDDLYLVINEYAYDETASSILAGATTPNEVEVPLVEGFKLYPMPASNMVNVRMEESRQYDVKVVDMTGRTVMSSRFEGLEYSMDITELKSGMYILQLSSGELRLNKELLVN